MSARFSKTLIRPTLCLPLGKWVADIGNDGRRLKELTHWPYSGRQEVTMDLKDRRLWYGVAVIVVLIVIAYAAGWFGGTPTPVPPQ
jgi:hypothetical protein